VTGRYKFVAHTDRGPNAEPTGILRPFLLPDFAPEVVRFELDRETGKLTFTQRIQLKDSNGDLLTGLPNTSLSANASQPYNDEVPVDLLGNVLPLDPLGADMEGIVFLADGSFWMCDEYRPALYHFDATGTLIRRVRAHRHRRRRRPARRNIRQEHLPAVLAQRRQNRGFEAIALDNGRIYAFVQSPLRNPVSRPTAVELNATATSASSSSTPPQRHAPVHLRDGQSEPRRHRQHPRRQDRRRAVARQRRVPRDRARRRSDADGKINLRPWPVKGMFLPDAMASLRSGSETYLLTANEGDVREWGGFAENVRVGSGSVVLDPAVFPLGVILKNNSNLGRLTISNVMGRTGPGQSYQTLYAFGGRSFSVWSTDGKLVWDSGDDFERITAEAYPAHFNASNSNQTFDNRSDDKGPEPEGIVVGKAYGRDYAFIGLERIGGIMVYDLSDPKAPQFVTYVNRRDFTAGISTPAAGDLGPEGLLFIKADDSPTGRPLLVTGNEISGTTSLFEIMPGKERRVLITEGVCGGRHSPP
jgi:hypothetical protein